MAIGLLVVLVAGAVLTLVGPWSPWSSPRGTGPQPGSAPAASPVRPTVSAEQAPAEPPCRGVAIGPADDLQAVLDAHPAGTTFCFAAGRYPEATLRPRPGDRFVAPVEAVFSGARRVERFDVDGHWWSALVDLGPVETSGYCLAGSPRCDRPRRLFLDDAALRPVARRADLRPGTFHLDDDGRRLTVADNPEGHIVEIAVVPALIDSDVTDLQWVGGTVERYASPSQRGAIQARPGASGWQVRHTTFRQNSGAGLAAEDHRGLWLADCTFVDNGQIGLTASGSDLVVEHTAVTGNNTAGFEPSWEAGGMKFTRARGLTVRANQVSGNLGPGIWVDIDSADATITANLVEGNADAGIFYEISQRATISANVVRGNGTGLGERWCYGAGIVVSASAEVSVTGNVVVDNQRGISAIQQDRGAGPDGPRLLRAVSVVANVVAAERRASPSGICDDVDGAALSAARANRFDANRYLGAARSWSWPGHTTTSLAQWQRLGQDPGATAEPLTAEAMATATTAAGVVPDIAARAGPRSTAR